MKDQSNLKQELIGEKAKPKHKQTKAALDESEQNYRLLATYHKRLNDISISFTEATGTENLFNRIAESFRYLTDATAAIFSVYDQKTRALKVVALSLNPSSGVKASSIFGPKLYEARIPVSAEDMENMLTQGIRRSKDLHELSRGVMPQEISDAIMEAAGCRQIIALAIGHAEELIGTCVAYLSGDQPMVPDDALKTYAYLSGIEVKRRQAEGALEESEKKYRLIAENTADLIAIMDMNLRLTYLSPTVFRLRGFTVAETMEQTLEQVLTPDSLRLVTTAFLEEMQLEDTKTADPGRTPTLELEEYKKDGSTIWVEVNFSFLRDKDRRPVGILSVTRDISDRKKAKEKLGESEARYRNLFDASPDGIIVIGTDGCVMDANPAQGRMYGYGSTGDLIGVPATQFVAPSARNYAAQILQRRLNGEDIPSVEYECVRKNGTIFYAEVTATILRRPDGTVSGYICITRDGPVKSQRPKKCS